jgi:F420-dependent oxidoreductase-like protein
MQVGMFSSMVNQGTVEEVVAEAAAAESDGLASFWAPQIFGHDALTALAIIGREVPRIELGTSVVPTFPRHPHALAQQAATVQAATGGRLCLGVGLSHQIVIESMLGLSFDQPLRHMREYLSVLVPLSRGETAAFDGETIRTHAPLAVAGATPFPIVVAALGPKMLALAGSVADGTITWCVGSQTLAGYTVPTITAAAEAAGRPPPRVIAAIPVCVTDDPDAVRERAASALAMYGQLPSYRKMLDREGAEGPADIAIVGQEAEVEAGLAHLGDVGVTDLAAVEIGTNPDDRERTRALLRRLTG